MILKATILGLMGLIPTPDPLPHAFDRPIADITVTSTDGSLLLTLMMNFQFLDLALGRTGAPAKVPQPEEVEAVRKALVAAFRADALLRAGGQSVGFEPGKFELSPPSAALRAREPQLARLLTQVRFSLRVPAPPTQPVALHWKWYPEHALYPVPNSPVAPMKVNAVVVEGDAKPRVLEFHTAERVQTIWSPKVSAEAAPAASPLPTSETAAAANSPAAGGEATEPRAEGAPGKGVPAEPLPASASASRFPWWALALGGVGVAVLVPFLRNSRRASAALGLLLLLVLQGCDAKAPGEAPSGAGAAGAAGASKPAKAVATKPMTLTGASKSYRATAKTADGTIPLNEPFTLEVVLTAEAGAAAPRKVLVNADMPSHGHGMNTKPRVTEIGEGRWRAEGMLFHMPGAWEVYVYVGEGQAMERIALPVKL